MPWVQNSRKSRLMQLEIDEKLAKEQRRYEREERRKAKLLAKLKVKSSEDINEKILKEEKKLLKAQRKLEAIRLIEELFKRINIKKEKNKLESKRNNEGSELNRLKSSSEMEVRQQKEKLNQVIQGRTVLKSLLTDSSHIKNQDDSSSSDSSTKKKEKRENYQNNREMVSHANQHVTHVIPTGDWYNGYPPQNGMFPYQVPPVYSHPMNYQFNYQSHNRGRGRGVYPGSSRSNYYPRGGRGRRYRGQVYPPELHAQYYRYFEKFLNKYDEHDHRRSRTRSPRSRSHSPSRSRSRSRRRGLSHSKKRSHSRSKSSSRHSRSKSRSRSRTRRSRRSSRSKSKSSYTHSKRKSSRSRRQSTSAKRSTSRHLSRSRSLSRKSKDKRKSRSPSYRSIDSSKFISPSRLRMPRSKSWSLPN